MRRFETAFFFHFIRVLAPDSLARYRVYLTTKSPWMLIFTGVRNQFQDFPTDNPA
jgi:hypothetical protein